MFCKYCGKELPDGSNFCKHCGKKLMDDAETQPAENVTQTPTPAAAQAVSSTPISDTFKNAMQDGKKKKVIIGVIVAAVVVIVAIVGFNIYSSTVPASAVEAGLKQSDTFTKGFVSNDYTNESAYSFSDIKITKSENPSDSYTASSVASMYGGKDIKSIEFEGKMKNDSFESQFSGKGTVVKGSNGWQMIGTPTKTWSTTKPLKAVEKFDLGSSSSSSYSSSSSDTTTSSENFTAELNDNDGVYTCEASQDYKIEYWFGADTAAVKQNFKFNPEKGWEKQGDQEITNQKTEYSLAGKTFECTSTSILGNMTDTLSLTFKNSDKTENPTADYSIAHSTGSSTSEYNKAVNLSGSANGTIKHKFGENSFSIELNDAGQQVTFSGNSSYAKEVAGVGKMNTMYLSVKTNANSYESQYSSTKYSTSGTFVETKKATT